MASDGSSDAHLEESGADSPTDSSPSWRILRIMSEFVDGFSFLEHVPRSVTFFGSARLHAEHPYYELARTLARRLAERGYAIVTGGGPGIMQAGNQGAVEGNGMSVGLNIQLPMEQRMNPYVRQSKSFHYFFSRKVMLDYSAEAFIFFPGGFGTLDELFELLTLVQTGKRSRGVPILLVGTSYWQPMTQWLEQTLLREVHTINPSDLEMFHVTDDLDEVIERVEQGVRAGEEERQSRTGHRHASSSEMLRQATRHAPETEQ